MFRIFSEHELRPVQSLDGLWSLTPQDGSGRTFHAIVPGVWERIPALANFRGIADYTRTVHIKESGSLLLRFGGVSHTARVFWDGVQIAQHYNAYTAFEALVENAAAGDHTLRVEVDDRFTEDSTLHIPNDYTTYGGVNRPVELHCIGSAYLARMAFHATQQDEGAYTAHVRVWVKALQPADDLTVSVNVAGSQAQCDVPALSAGEEACVAVEFPVSGVTPWDVLDAHLYDLTATLLRSGKPVDDLIDRVGFRKVEVVGEDILLNGRKIYLKGFNRHEDHGQSGCALSVGAMMDDIQLILDMGANSIRTCHYPNDPRFLDLCDAMGVLVWEENHARAIPGDIMRKPLFAQQCSNCNEEMIAQHVNHPSIFVWGLLNECDTQTEFGRSVYATQIAQLRSLDPTRPITFASCSHYKDICLDLADIISFNVYPGWYITESTEDYFAKHMAWLEANGAKGKPIFYSEFGAGAIAGFHDVIGHATWSEERQCDILQDAMEYLLNCPRVSGAYIWQFADVPVADVPDWSMRRPKTQNNKGIVDMYRRPKLAYNTVKALFSGKK